MNVSMLSDIYKQNLQNDAKLGLSNLLSLT